MKCNFTQAGEAVWQARLTRLPFSRNDAVEGGVPFNAETQRTRRNAELGQFIRVHLLVAFAGRFSAQLCLLRVSALKQSDSIATASFRLSAGQCGLVVPTVGERTEVEDGT